MGWKVICPYCNQEAELIDSRDWYKDGVDYGSMYVCRPCNASVGCHPDGKPLGTLASPELKKLRIKCHAKFDALWKPSEVSRKDAYRWLKHMTGIEHFGETNEDECKMALEILIDCDVMLLTDKNSYGSIMNGCYYPIPRFRVRKSPIDKSYSLILYYSVEDEASLQRHHYKTKRQAINDAHIINKLMSTNFQIYYNCKIVE